MKTMVLIRFSYETESNCQAAQVIIPPAYEVYKGYIVFAFLAHLSRRLIGELIGYSWSGVRPPSTMLKYLLRNRWADQSQILCGTSLGRGNDILFAAFGSHDQDGRHTHIW